MKSKLIKKLEYSLCARKVWYDPLNDQIEVFSRWYFIDLFGIVPQELGLVYIGEFD